ITIGKYSGDASDMGTEGLKLTVKSGDVVSGYELGSMLGHGGMGEVWSAKQPRIGRNVAVKRIRGLLTDDKLEDFAREARISAFLEHPNIVPVHDLIMEQEDSPMMAMKLVRG